MDADGDGRITAEEWKGPQEFFRMLDRDGDGAVTETERQAMGLAIDAEQMYERFGLRRPDGSSALVASPTGNPNENQPPAP